jgi:hypothetical protein
MSPKSRKNIDSLLKKLEEEIVPIFEEVITSAISIENLINQTEQAHALAKEEDGNESIRHGE